MIPPKTYRDYLRGVVAEEARPPHKYGHQVRLYELAVLIGADLQYDDDVVFAAIWLHDLGVFEGNRPSDLAALERWDHVEYAVARCTALLAETDFPAQKIAHVCAVIREHQPKDRPTSLEATMVRDADILEQLGAVAVLRTAAKLGSDTRFTRFVDVTNYLRRQGIELPRRLELLKSRDLAIPRQHALNAFLDQLEKEGVTKPSES